MFSHCVTGNISKVATTTAATTSSAAGRIRRTRPAQNAAQVDAPGGFGLAQQVPGNEEA